MKIRAFAPQDFGPVVSTMTAAFADDPLYRYFIPDDSRRQTFLTRFMAFRLRYGLAYGKVFVTDDCQGAALWLAPGHSMNPLDLLRFGGIKAMIVCNKESRRRVMDFNTYADRCMAAAAPPHRWHLSPICVAPACQGRGYGHALTAQGLEMLRSDGSPCCLETQSARNVAFYESCGFRIIAQGTAANGALTHTVMQWP